MMISYSGRSGQGVFGCGGYENLFNALRTSVEPDGRSEKVFKVTRAKLIKQFGREAHLTRGGGQALQNETISMKTLRPNCPGL
jgi:hypothetical protein